MGLVAFDCEFEEEQFDISLVCFQLFRRVAASLPGMEQNEQKKEDSILSFLPQSCPPPCMSTSSLCAVIAAWLNASSILTMAVFQ